MMIGSRLMHAHPLPVPMTVTEITRHCLIRKGAVPILEVTVRYPSLTGEADGRVQRFNRAYEAISEAFWLWADRVLGKEVSEAYAAMGIAAAYCFDCRLVVCTMEMDPLNSQGSKLVIRRTVTYGSRRGTVDAHALRGTDTWRIPSLTQCSEK